MKKDDHIRVRNGIIDPDFKRKDLSGYTGYIEDIDEYNMVGILWDESTLKRFDTKFIKKCYRKNMDYRRMVLTVDEIELIEAK